MAWLRTPAGGCDCPDCGTGPCDPGCACDFAEDGGSDCFEGPVTDNFNVTGQFITAHDLDITWSATNVQIVIKANGATIWTAPSCNGSGTDTVSVPAGTTLIEVEMTDCGATCTPLCNCDVSYEIACAV